MDTQSKQPTLFLGHGDPQIAIHDDELTRELATMGTRIRQTCGTPRAILMLSAHWYTNGLFVQSTPRPRQIFDMYGFPQALYDVKYEVEGCAELTESVVGALGTDVAINDDWGIDHGTWTVLMHMFPEASIPVVQLSCNALASMCEQYELGARLAHLRDEGFMIAGSGNVVHNLMAVDWDCAGGTPEADFFDEEMARAVRNRDDRMVLDYHQLAGAGFCVPTPEHLMPLPFVLGASKGEVPVVFNEMRQYAGISMTSFAFGV